jgi:hypothetical protein
MNEDVKVTQELPVVDTKTPPVYDPERQIETAGSMIDSMLHALGGAKMYRNHYSIWTGAKPGCNNWWLLVGLGMAKKESDYKVDGEEYLVFSVTCQGISHLKAIGAFARKSAR